MEVYIVKPKTVFGKAKYKLLNAEIRLGYLIPKGFVSDGSTVPRPFWWLFPPVSSYFDATVLHDYLLKTNKFPRFVCDKLFLAQMEVDKVSKPVRLFKFCMAVAYGFIKTAGYLSKQERKNRKEYLADAAMFD